MIEGLLVILFGALVAVVELGRRVARWGFRK